MTISSIGALARYKLKSGLDDVPDVVSDLIEAIVEEIQANATVSGNINGNCFYSGAPVAFPIKDSTTSID